MNRARRKELEKAFDLVTQAIGIPEAVKTDEWDAYNNLPDNFRDEEIQNAIDMLDETSGYLEDARSVIEQI